MPYIDLKTNKAVTNEEVELIKSDLGSAITAIRGKSEAWLMVKVEGECNMFFKGEGDPCAMFEVSIFGNASDTEFEDLTGRICKISEERLGVPASRTYVKYAEVDTWGWNNMNF